MNKTVFFEDMNIFGLKNSLWNTHTYYGNWRKVNWS